MKPRLDPLKGMKICVAVSGGRDSVALLHELSRRSGELGISLSALNCEHGLRGESSKRDSEFVKSLCEKWEIPLACFSADCKAFAIERGVSEEVAARDWRRHCYVLAAEMFCGGDLENFAIATAHHANDNAETVLFNIARGSGSAGACGIGYFGFIPSGTPSERIKIVRPLIGCTRREIDGYIEANGLRYVEDETNLSARFTRNYMRINVIPQLENCVRGAVENIYRFSRLMADDEEYFDKLIDEKGIVRPTFLGVKIARCEDKAVFRRAALKSLKMLDSQVKDYTSEHINALYLLQDAERGKRFEFLGFTAFNEGGEIALCKDGQLIADYTEIPLSEFIGGKYSGFCGVPLNLKIQSGREYAANKAVFEKNQKTLFANLNAFPEGAVIRFRRSGDVFKKFGSGEKSLNDYFTDCKIPIRLRDRIPLLACGNEIIAVCGSEISERVKITGNTRGILEITCENWLNF